jgi:hypothetical protein
MGTRYQTQESKVSELKLIQKAADQIGYSEKAIQRKIQDGVWIEGYEYVRAPDGRILIDLGGFERWARGQPRELRSA